jgi:hypothetical protein
MKGFSAKLMPKHVGPCNIHQCGPNYRLIYIIKIQLKGLVNAAILSLYVYSPVREEILHQPLQSDTARTKVR